MSVTQPIQSETARAVMAGARPRAVSGRAPFLYPRFRALPPPLIVIGMHRSGTSLVSAMLAALGVYMGPESRTYGELGHLTAGQFRSGYAEAQSFYLANELLLSRAGASWDRVEPFLQARDRPHFARTSVLLLQDASLGYLRSGYLDPLPREYRGPWGWKDPRTSLTLPYWLRLFPDARVLHVRRDPEAVASSVWRRASKGARVEEGAPPAAQQLPLEFRLQWALCHPEAAFSFVGRRLGLGRPQPASAAPTPCLDQEYCLRLGEQYTAECLRHRDLGDRYLEVRFEDLLEDPVTGARELARFAACPPSEEALVHATALVRGERKSGQPLW